MTYYKIRYQDQDFVFDLMKIPTEELREVKRKTGLTVRKFLSGVVESDVDALLALRWCILRSDGRHDDLTLDPDDPFDDYWQFAEAWNASEEIADADPTEAGSLPATSTPASSESSGPTLMSSPESMPSLLPVTAESANGKSASSLSEGSSATSPALTL